MVYLMEFGLQPDRTGNWPGLFPQPFNKHSKSNPLPPLPLLCIRFHRKYGAKAGHQLKLQLTCTWGAISSIRHGLSKQDTCR